MSQLLSGSGSCSRILPLALLTAGLVLGTDRITQAVGMLAEEPASSAESKPETSNNANEETIRIALAAERPRRVSGLRESQDATRTQFFEFEATAYCLKGLTASGVPVQPGIIAADPSLLPLGTVVEVVAGLHTGRYTVLDTGGAIKGRRIDIYIPSYREAIGFGRRTVKLRVVRADRARIAKNRRGGNRRVS